MRIAISSGHSKHVRGAAGVLDEVNEARRVTDRVAELLRGAGVGVEVFHDNTSSTKNENLTAIVNWHNRQSRDLDVSIHFNAFQKTDKPMGTECLWVTQEKLAALVASSTAKAGHFINRGAKKRTDLYFLNKTNRPSILDEVCFVDSTADAELYRLNFNSICLAIAESIANIKVEQPAAPAQPPTEHPVNEPEDFPAHQTNIKCSVFGGSKDPNDSAYPPYNKISDTEVSCALPWRFQGERPLVRIRNVGNGQEAIARIRDVGPWLIDDNYWQLGTRPLAEMCFVDKVPLPRGPHKGKVGNGAGIDITPGCAKAIGLSGMGFVDWMFAEPLVS